MDRSRRSCVVKLQPDPEPEATTAPAPVVSAVEIEQLTAKRDRVKRAVDDKWNEVQKIGENSRQLANIKSQINDAGQPTAWCQQHDEVSLQPAWARKFEPPSICNGESAGLVTFLMSIDHPDKEIITAVRELSHTPFTIDT